MSIAYHCGKFMPVEDVRLPLRERAFYFGDGIYDAALGFNGKIYMEKEHIERFFESARATHMHTELTEDKLSLLLREAARRSAEECFFIYFQLTRIGENRQHAYPREASSSLLITVTAVNPPSPDSLLRLSLFEDKRYFYCNIKTINLLPAVLACSDAQSRGYDEAVFHRGRTVTECAHSNISILKNGELYTHPEGEMILPGIARRALLNECLNMGLVCHDTPFTVDDLLCADEVLVTSSTKICMRAAEIEGRKYTVEKNTLGYEICVALWKKFASFCETTR